METLRDITEEEMNAPADSEPEDCNIKAVDAYKQYASIFYTYYQKKDFFIPVYDCHNEVEALMEK
jgi:hypothetical protein